jgi:DNA-binding NarL/FixJ family response regulator
LRFSEQETMRNFAECVANVNDGETADGRVMTTFTFARILIVDDFPGWRARIREILATHPEWKIISEASDGQEAVQQASELQPDIVLLDIALPRLNGIEAAKMIRRQSPKSRIIFFTQDNDDDITKAALGVGQAIYLSKTKGGSWLCNAIAACLRERTGLALPQSQV